MKKLTNLVPLLLIFLVSCQEDKLNSYNELTLDTESIQNMSWSEAEFEFGRALFYDPRLSFNNSVSCATCHKQELAFSDDVPFSMGLRNKPTLRNTLPIQNLAFSSFLFWDGRERSLQRMVTQPIENHIEMGERDLEDMVAELNDIPHYRAFVDRLYGSNGNVFFGTEVQAETVQVEHVAASLAAFLIEINAVNTKFDRHLFENESLSAKELRGMNLFVEKYECNGCHGVQSPDGYIFAGTFSNIGLESEYEDIGLEGTTGDPLDNGKFKIPSLRNITLTAPYMHDGRFETLEEVIDHYSAETQDNENLDFRLRDANGKPIVFNISQDEKEAIIAFLGTLTDYEMITDPRFSNPYH